tara:strand:- start:13122 stop:13316 length:195 start_codon:yes stop_codon:yes gene_type:complete
MMSEGIANIVLILLMVAIVIGFVIPLLHLLVANRNHRQLYTRNRMAVENLIDRVAENPVPTSEN